MPIHEEQDRIGLANRSATIPVLTYSVSFDSASHWFLNKSMIKQKEQKSFVFSCTDSLCYDV